MRLKKRDTILALDAATDTLSLALQHGDQVLCWEGPGGALASQVMLPQIQQLMQQAQLGFSDLDVIAFGAGPGAFTGVRGACSVAQGLAFANGTPLIALNTLHAIAKAYASRHGHTKVLALLDARMNEWYWQCFDFDRVEPEIDKPQVTARAQVVCPLGFAVVEDPALQRPSSRIYLQMAQQIRDDFQAAGAGTSHEAMRRQLGFDPLELDPFHLPGLRYVRNKVAQTTAERAMNPVLP